MLNLILALINSGVFQINFGYSVLAIYEIFFFQIATRGKIIINALAKSSVWLLAVSGLMYGFALYTLGTRSMFCLVEFCLLPVLTFISGYMITDRNDGKSTLSVEKCLYAIALGCAVRVTLNIVANIGIASRSETVDFFSGRLSATNLGSLNTFIFALLPCLIITKRKKIKVIGLIFFSLSVIYAFILGTRTPIYALVIMTLISFIIYARRHYSDGIKVNVLLKWCCIAVAIVGTVYMILATNFLNVRTRIEASTLVLRYSDTMMGTSDSARLKYFQEGIKNLFAHPMGGNQTNGIRYFHNYWLDVGRIAGVIPVILLVIMDVMLFVHMWKIIKNRSIDEDLRYALFGIYVCVFVNFFFEPIMDGYLDLFYRFIFISGMVEGLHRTLYHQSRFVIHNYCSKSSLYCKEEGQR